MKSRPMSAVVAAGGRPGPTAQLVRTAVMVSTPKVPMAEGLRRYFQSCRERERIA